MSFQAGLLCLDGRTAGRSESAAVLACVCASRSEAPVSRHDGPVFLGHSTSVVAGRTCAATFDGRLDNRDDLRDRLRGDLREDTGDAALALAAWEKWGADGLAQLIGDWSAVLWDSARQTIVLASDFAGVRPLYYAVERGRALWSTRLRPLVDYLHPSDIDEEYVAGMMTSGGCPNRTPYRGIRSVPPGHTVAISAAGTKIARFWQLPLEETIRYAKDVEYEEHLRALFREAVRSRVPDAARCFCDLSGGLDSSSVVCMAAEMIREGAVKPASFVTITVEHEGSRDAPFYTSVERHCGFQAVHLPAASYPFLTQTDPGGALPSFWEPLLKCIGANARETGVTTYLTGKLGDEIMGNWGDDSDQVAGLLRSGRIGTALGQSLAWSKCMRIPVGWILWRAIRSNLPGPFRPSYERGISAWPDGPKDEEDSIAPAFRQRHGLADANGFFSQEWRRARPERRRRLRNLTTTLELRRLQTPEALEHLDYTHPYMHRPLMSFMLSIPADVICRPGEPRRLMRRAFDQLLPPKLQTRRSKDNFGTVFLDSLRPLARELLKPDEPLQLVERGFADRDSLTKRLERMSSSMKCNESQLRNLILLEFWLRRRESEGRCGAELAEFRV